MVTCLCTRVYIPEAVFYIPVFITLVSTSSVRIHCRSILRIKVHINSSFFFNTTTAVYIILFHNLASVFHSTPPSTTPTISEVANPPLTKDQQTSSSTPFECPIALHPDPTSNGSSQAYRHGLPYHCPELPHITTYTMTDRNYGSSGSSRGSTPSPRSSKSYLEPLSIQKGTTIPYQPHAPPSLTTSTEPKQQQHTSSYSSHYPDTYLEPSRSTLIGPRGESSHSRSSGNKSSSHSSTSGRKSGLKPLSIHQPTKDSYTPRDDIQSDKRSDPRYYTNSFLDSGNDSKHPKKHSSSSRKNMDSRYYPNSSF